MSAEESIQTRLADGVRIAFQADAAGEMTGKITLTLLRVTDNLDDPVAYTTCLVDPSEADEIASVLTQKAQELRDVGKAK